MSGPRPNAGPERASLGIAACAVPECNPSVPAAKPRLPKGRGFFAHRQSLPRRRHWRACRRRIMSAAMPPRFLSHAELDSVIRLAPLIAIDLIIRNGRDEVLLGLRKNEPAKG